MYNKYGAEVINLEGPIPAHLMGNMWAQDWLSIYDLVEPYSGKVRPDATPGILEKVRTLKLNLINTTQRLQKGVYNFLDFVEYINLE